MDNVKLNTSSAMAGIFSYAPYQTSDASADAMPVPVENRNDSGPDVPLSGPASQYDSVSISPQARRLYDASASAPSSIAPSLLGMPAENIALYNQIRRERDALTPGDPRIVELTDKLRTVIMAGDKTLDSGDLSYHHGDADSQAQTTGQEKDSSLAQPRTAERLADTSESKSRHTRRGTPHAAYTREKSGDSAGLSFALPYPAPDASADPTPFSAHASSSASPRIHRSALGTLDYQGFNALPSGRLYRVA